MRKLILAILVVLLAACNLPAGNSPATLAPTETTRPATPLPVNPTASSNPALPTENPSSTISLVYIPGSTQKVCQLLGDVDWETGQPTAARTFSNGGLLAADLGYPVEHLGKLILLFGDSWPPPHPKNESPRKARFLRTIRWE